MADSKRYHLTYPRFKFNSKHHAVDLMFTSPIIACLFAFRQRNVAKLHTLREIAQGINEADIVIELGKLWRPLVRFNFQGPVSAPDIVIDGFDIQVEVKYWKGSTKDGIVRPRHFDVAFRKDWDWLVRELQAGHRNRRAFIACWPTVLDWKEMISPIVFWEDDLPLVPFLKVVGDPPTGMAVNRKEDHGWIPVDGLAEPIRWRRFGTRRELLNMVMMW